VDQAGRPSEARLISGVAIHQLICWGTLYSVFPAFLGPMEAEFGWSRAETSGAFTAALLAAGLAAIPVGRWVDRHGSRGVMTLGAAAGAACLVGWAMVPSLPMLYALWIAIGVVHAMAFSEPAFAALTANSRDPKMAVQYATALTGLTTTIFLPAGALLIEWLGWRTTLLCFAGLQLVPAVAAAVLLRGIKGSLTGSSAATGAALRRALKRRAFWALAVTFCSLAFAQAGLTFHILPLLMERGLPLAAAVAVVAVQGPCQVGSRLILLALGRRVRDIRQVGAVAVTALPLSMLVLVAAPNWVPVLMLYGVLMGAANGLMTILRVTGTAEILGTEGFGQIAGALSACTVLPRTAAPLVLALAWEAQGSYALVPWILLGVALMGTAGFLLALTDRPRAGAP
jgi:MFS family permease